MSASVTHLSKTPWCHALINDPDWTPTNTASRVPKSTAEDSFFAETLGTDRTIRHCLTLRPKVAKDEDSPLAYPKVRTIMELGNGLNGHPNICHGGFVATMLDEVCGVLITINLQRRMELGLGQNLNTFTAYLNTNYKKPVPTPNTVLCTAKLERVERNKIYVRATVEDGNGVVYTTGEGMFVEVNMKPRM